MIQRLRKNKFFIVILTLCLAACSTAAPETETTTTEMQVPPTAEASLPEPTVTLGVGSAMAGLDGMQLMYVPAGELDMGGSDHLLQKLKEDIPWVELGFDISDSEPSHQVYLDAYWIDQTEVTMAQYQKCVVAGVCVEPAPPGEYNAEQFWPMYEDPAFADYPIVYVNWDMANAYCGWAGRRLPTEAEWEKAARGEDGLMYPWGNEKPNNDYVNFGYANSDVDRTIYEQGISPVDAFPLGASPYSVLDLAGNVSEWVRDFYDPSYYLESPENNPTGPDSGIEHVIRGQSFLSNYSNGEYLITIRSHGPQAYYWGNLGFRCALSVE